MDILNQFEPRHRDEEMYKIVGAAMEVHKILGPGLLEKAYGDALEIELQLRGIQYEREKELPILYKAHTLPTHYYADFVCYDSIIVELKAVTDILPIHEAQIMHYMNISGMNRGILFNFDCLKLYYDKF